MSVPKWLEDFFHGVMGLAFPAVLLWAREWTRVRLPWPFKGQWPPGVSTWFVDAEEDSALFPYENDAYEWAAEIESTWGETGFPGDPITVAEMSPTERVADIGRDSLGYAIGQDLRTALLVGAVVWVWHG